MIAMGFQRAWRALCKCAGTGASMMVLVSGATAANG